MKTAYEVLKESDRISREVIAAKVDGEVLDLSREVADSADVQPLTFDDAEGKRVFWHTASHVLAAAVKRLYPEAKLTIGPSIDNGFYYDIDSDVPFTQETLPLIEREMQRIVKENAKMERFVLPRDEAIKLMEEAGEPYKVLLIGRVPEGEDISFYRMGDFVDLCAGWFRPPIMISSVPSGGLSISMRWIRLPARARTPLLPAMCPARVFSRPC